MSDHVRAGVTNYNKGPMEFENGSRIVSATTTGNTGRGMSIILLYCDEFAFVYPILQMSFDSRSHLQQVVCNYYIRFNQMKIHLLNAWKESKINLTTTETKVLLV